MPMSRIGLLRVPSDDESAQSPVRMSSHQWALTLDTVYWRTRCEYHVVSSDVTQIRLILEFCHVMTNVSEKLCTNMTLLTFDGPCLSKVMWMNRAQFCLQDVFVSTCRYVQCTQHHVHVICSLHSIVDNDSCTIEFSKTSLSASVQTVRSK